MLRPATLIALAVLIATPAAAQSFLKDLAKSAARQATEAAVRNVMTPEPGGASAQAGQPAGAKSPAAAQARKPSRTYLSDIAKPADAADKKKALDDFSTYSCDDCEGGRGYDSWARHGLNMVGGHAFEDRIGALPVGGSVSWKGRAANGEITVVAEAEHDGFPCKEVVWKMTKPKTKATAERDGLFCYGYASSYSGKETWAEIY